MGRNRNSGHLASPVTREAVPAHHGLAAILSVELVDAIETYIDERVTAALAELAPPNGSEPEWLTLEQAGERLGCTADAIRMRANRGRLNSKHVGRRRYVSRASVDG